MLNHEMQILQDELEEMATIKRKFEVFSKDSESLLLPEFLSVSSALNKNIERVLSRPILETKNVKPWELPHELKEIRESLDQSKVLEEALRFKKKVIWKLLS